MRQGARGASPLPWDSRGETVLWGLFGAKGTVSVAHVMLALSTGRASRNRYHIGPQGRVLTGAMDMLPSPGTIPLALLGAPSPERESCCHAFISLIKPNIRF